MLPYNDGEESSSSSSSDEEVSLYNNFLLNNPRYNDRRTGQRWSSPAELLPELADLSFNYDLNSDDDDDDDDSSFSRVISGLVQKYGWDVDSESSTESFDRFINNLSSTSLWSSSSSESESLSSLEFKEESNEEEDDDDEEEEEEEEHVSDLLPYDLLTDELVAFVEEVYSQPEEGVLPAYGYTSDEEEEESVGSEPDSDQDTDQTDVESAYSYFPSEEDEENDDPTYQMVVGRSLFEEWLLLREGELLKTPETKSLLCILRDTILSPVATLIVKFHAPSEWRTCRSCGGFVETHCCLQAHGYEPWDEESDEEVVEDHDFVQLQLSSESEDEEEVEDFPINFLTYHSLRAFGEPAHVFHTALSANVFVV